MAHKTLDIDLPTKKDKTFKIPQLNGKFGISLYVRSKEVFIGVAIGQVEIEQIVRRRMVKNTKSRVKVVGWD